MEKEIWRDVFVRHVDGDFSNNRADNLEWWGKSKKQPKENTSSAILTDINTVAELNVDGCYLLAERVLKSLVNIAKKELKSKEQKISHFTLSALGFWCYIAGLDTSYFVENIKASLNH